MRGSARSSSAFFAGRCVADAFCATPWAGVLGATACGRATGAVAAGRGATCLDGAGFAAAGFCWTGRAGFSWSSGRPITAGGTGSGRGSGDSARANGAPASGSRPAMRRKRSDTCMDGFTAPADPHFEVSRGMRHVRRHPLCGSDLADGAGSRPQATSRITRHGLPAARTPAVRSSSWALSPREPAAAPARIMPVMALTGRGTAASSRGPRAKGCGNARRSVPGG